MLKRRGHRTEPWGNTKGDRAGGDECELIPTVEERLEM